MVELEANIEAFNKAMLAIADEQVPETANKFKRVVALKVLRGVVLKSPVDTGRFRGNWHVSLGSPTSSEVKGAEGIGAPDKSPAAAAATVAGLENKEIVQVKFGQNLWINNNVPYAGRIENGHSQQAPGGVVALTLAEVKEEWD